FVVAQIPPRALSRFAVPAFIAGVLLLIAVLVFGEMGKGAQRWLDIGPLTIQPSEIMKLAMPLMLAWYMNQRPIPPSIYRLFGALV
ncbi:FtsW/RodA/SpoVE family cell cycle protein, partial [Pseudoalteromonas sp. SIMBA_162]